MEQRHRPECRYAETCGGCQLQNLTYPEQLAFKQRKMEALLGKFGPVAPIIGMKNPWHYRNKVQAAFGFSPERGIVSGIYQASSHRIVPVSHCLIENDTAGGIIRTIRELMPEFKITAYDERTETGFLRHVLVKHGFATGEVMVVLVAAEPIFKLQKLFLKKLLELHPEITTVVLNVNDKFGPVVLGDQEKVIYGKGYIEDVLCGLTFRISAKSFYQVNPVQAEVLYKTAMRYAALTGKERVLDAYCGIGTIGMIASRQAGEVVGIELNRDAVRDAIANAKRNGIQNCWFTQGDAGDFLHGMAKERVPLDVVFLDPPRDGSDRKFLSSLLAMRPKRIVYISCGPESLARDLQVLTDGGYTVKGVQPVDMFPHTEHVETVVLMSRAKE
ncbi:MAG TPA: 23S rRNA (uracil(1939)-C(5))-methyltransferase RlmD [Oscillospiraceae bacterium]|nr:23S rRNA (uracil(1939)-C(5))-methyltransferase RlmD [Oscillospiraceae bacterium]HRW56923.1 23S rRNA (uracil(1939)-C(5))-methyltransferase RlmD [Oscillospiraceae bacterium]